MINTVCVNDNKLQRGNMKKLCLILNLAPHYRKAIYQSIDNEFDCDWYVGDRVDDIKTLSPHYFKHCKVITNKFILKRGYIQVGMLRLLFDKRYERYLVTGDIRNISLWMFLLLSKLFYSKKVYAWTHGNNGKGSKVSNVIKNIFIKLCDGVFVYGNYAKNYMITQGISPKKLYVIHNSLDYNKQVECRKRLQLTTLYQDYFNNSYNNIIFIGRLTSVKRLDLLLKAFQILTQRGKNYNITFVGDGVERENLRKIVNEYNLNDRVWFYGPCYDEHINAELIYNADLCVSPGNVGLTAIHSMVFGTPVATHNNFVQQMPEFEAVVEGVTGTYFDYLDAGSIADAIESWFEANADKREVVRQNCMREVDVNWTPTFQINVLKEHLDL